MTNLPIVIIGAGIAGASLAYRLAPHRPVLLLEAEERAGLHSTGRSAAMFMESYGPPQARALTRAGRRFYEQPPPGFASVPLIAPRGALYAAWQGQQAALDALRVQLEGSGCRVDALDAAATLGCVPVLRADGLIGSLFEPDALDLDVDALHQGFLRGAKAAGAALLTRAALERAVRDAGGWRLVLADGRELRAAIVVDAAGAWAGEVAARCGVAPLSIEPRRRSIFSFDPPAGIDPRRWPVFATVGEDWYVKPDAGQLLGSPANADPVPAHDVQPEELDIATGIDRIQRDTTLTIRRPRRSWAGLRSFSPDGDLVIGFDAADRRFFWLAGQGGYGIQSAAGASELAASLILGTPPTEALREQGVDPAALAPQRFGR